MAKAAVAGACAVVLLLCSTAARAQESNIVFGTEHAVALRSNGEVLTWGENVMCQLGRPSGNSSGTPTLIMRNVQQVAAAATHSLALTVDGKVYGWGGNPEGALGLGNTNDQCEGPALVSSLSDKTIVHIATGYGFSMAVSDTGDLFCSGDNSMGQCPAAKGGRTDVFVPVSIPELSGKVRSVTAGLFHTLVVTMDGKLYAFGRGRDGQLGNGRTTNGFAAIPDITDVVSLAAGTWHSVAVRADGSVWMWGNNSRSQLCDGTTTNRLVPTRLTSLPATVKVGAAAAGGHSTLLRTTDGAVYACGDNQAGLLGVGAPMVVTSPTLVPVPASKSLRVSIGGANAAISPDGCAVQLAGFNDDHIVSSADTASMRTFTTRSNLSLCGPKPAQRLATLVREWPRGGESGCWAPRVEEDAAASKQFAGLRQAMLAAEDILRTNAAFMTAPVPVRYRTSLSAGPSKEGGARMHVKVVPERKLDGTRVWSAGCGVIPQLDRIGGAIHQVSVFFNNDARGQFISPVGTPPKRTGTVGGYPEYDNWVVISKDGRLPWIPQTLADKLDAEGARRERALADWNRQRAGMKPPNAAAAQTTYEMLRKNDPAGAERFLATIKEQEAEFKRQQQTVVPATTAQLEKQLSDFQKYRASFAPEQLRAPAVPGDPTGEEKRKADARMAALRVLTPDEQKQVDEWGAQGRAFERQAQAEGKSGNAAEAARLRVQANELGLKVRALRNAHTERTSYEILDILAQYELTILKPGNAEQAIGAKPDPSFPDYSDPNRIQVIAISFSVDPDARNVERRAWQQRIKETFDYAALAALIK